MYNLSDIIFQTKKELSIARFTHKVRIFYFCFDMTNKILD